jgi:hypothetical protein
VPAEVLPVPVEMQLEAAEADLVPAEVPPVPAEKQLEASKVDLVPSEEQMEAADTDLVPAEAPLVCTRARPADAARKRASLAVKGGSGPVLPSKREAGATSVHAVATRPLKAAEASTSPRRHRHLHGGMKACPPLLERSRQNRGALCQDHPGRGAKRLTRAVVKTGCPTGTGGFRVQGARGTCKQRGPPSQPSCLTDRGGARM